MISTIFTKIKKVIIMALQVAGLFGLSDVGTFISKIAHIPIPGSIWGLIILFLLLKFRIVNLKWIDNGGDWLVREMLLFFVPSSVGILSYSHLLLHQGVQIVITIFASTALVMLVTGTIADNIWKQKTRRQLVHSKSREEAL